MPKPDASKDLYEKLLQSLRNSCPNNTEEELKKVADELTTLARSEGQRLKQWRLRQDHDYLSTACHHKRHDQCRKTCKFCEVECCCECHE